MIRIFQTAWGKNTTQRLARRKLSLCGTATLLTGVLAICPPGRNITPATAAEVADQPPPAASPATPQILPTDPVVSQPPAGNPGSQPTPVTPPVIPETPATVPPSQQPPTTVPPPVVSTPSTIAPDTLPTGGNITAGNGNISAGGGSMTVNQQSQQMVAHWNTFNIGESASVNFQQPNTSSVALNTIHDQNPSQILGSLSANGQLYLVNSSGIIFGATAEVNVGGIVASTLAITDEEFMQGASSFNNDTTATPEDPAGDPKVEEKPGSPATTPPVSTDTAVSTAVSPEPTTTIAQGNTVQPAIPENSPATTSTGSDSITKTPPTTLTSPPAQDNPVSVTNQGNIQASPGGYVAFLAPQVKNEGDITSQNGSVVLAGGEKVNLNFAGDKLINYSIEKGAIDALAANKGLIKADSGMVVMTAKAATSLTQAVVNNSSVIEAKTLDNKGGRIILDAEGGLTQVSGILDVSAADGQGGKIVATGDQVLIASDAHLNSSGATGGGEVLIGGGWQGSDPAIHRAQNTIIEQGAFIEANATDQGKGGTVVTWSDDTTSFAGMISAKGGINGGDGGNAEVSGKDRLSFAGLVDLSATAGKSGDLLLDPVNFTIGSDVTGAALGAQLDLTNVIVQTGSGGSTAGNITVNEGLAWTSGTTLFMKAHNNILINEAIANSGGGQLLLRADSDADSSGTVLFDPSGQVTFTGGGTASLYYNPSGGYATPTDYSAEFTGVTPTAYMLVNNSDQLQAMNTNLAGTYALGKDIDAGATAGWGSGNSKGFNPIGTPTALGDGVSAPLYITFDGNGHTISDLYIYRPTMAYVGLFRGSTDGAPIFRNLWLEDVNITGGFQTGGAVAHLGLLPGGAGGHGISNSYVTGSVNGSNNVGGLVGLSAGPITNSYSKATVHGSTWVGGLVGTNWGNTARVTNSYSSGAVSGSSNVGGLVGYNYNTIASPVSNSYWDTQTSGRATSAGGTGKTTDQMKAQTTFSGWDFTNTWGIAEGSSSPYLTGGTLGMTGTTVTLASTAPTSADPHSTGPTATAPATPAQSNSPSRDGSPDTSAPKSSTVTISISSRPDTSGADHIADQISALPKPMPWQPENYPFASPWNINVPYYDSYDAYMTAHPPLAISWTDQAPHYNSWNDYLAEHPWYVTALAMNRSPQIDGEGRFIDGLVGPLDYLTTVGSGGIGFAGLEQGGDYQGYSETSGSYLTEQSWRANELDQLLQTLAAETAYNPEVAKMWEDAAVAKAKKNEAWQNVLDDLMARGIDESILDLLSPKAPGDSSLAGLLKDAGSGVEGKTKTEIDYLEWEKKLQRQLRTVTDIWAESHSFDEAGEFYDWMDTHEYANTLSFDEKLTYAKDNSLPQHQHETFLRSLYKSNSSLNQGLSTGQLTDMVENLSGDDIRFLINDTDLDPFSNVEGKPFRYALVRALSPDQLRELAPKLSASDIADIMHFAPEVIPELAEEFPENWQKMAKMADDLPWNIYGLGKPELKNPMWAYRGVPIDQLPAEVTDKNWMQNSMSEWYAKVQTTLPDSSYKDDFLASINSMMQEYGLTPMSPVTQVKGVESKDKVTDAGSQNLTSLVKSIFGEEATFNFIPPVSPAEYAQSLKRRSELGLPLPDERVLDAYGVSTQNTGHEMQQHDPDDSQNLISLVKSIFEEGATFNFIPPVSPAEYAQSLERRSELGLPLPDERVLDAYGVMSPVTKAKGVESKDKVTDAGDATGREQLDLKYRLLQQEQEYVNKQEIIGKANEYKEVSDEHGNLSMGYFEDLARKKYEKAIENEVKRYEDLGKESPEAGLVNELAWRELENYFEERKVALEKFDRLNAAEKAELLKDANLSPAGQAALFDKKFTQLFNQLITNILSKEAGFACIPFL